MQNYIKQNTYVPTNLKKEDMIIINSEKYQRIQIDPHHPSYTHSKEDFSHSYFKYPYLPLYLGDYDIDVSNISLSVLRLIIRENNENANIYLPKGLIEFKEFILENINYHRQFFEINKNAFVYLTVRACTYDELFYKNSQSWHIDGFQGSRIQRHIIEQDVFWCNTSPTDFLLQPMYCEGLDPSRFDINDFFEKNAKEHFKVGCKEKGVYLVTPYNIHRVNLLPFKGKRVFIRLNFSPVLIEDHTNTMNPLLPQYTFEKRRDVRDFLRSTNINEVNDSGFIF